MGRPKGSTNGTSKSGTVVTKTKEEVLEIKTKSLVQWAYDCGTTEQEVLSAITTGFETVEEETNKSKVKKLTDTLTPDQMIKLIAAAQESGFTV